MTVINQTHHDQLITVIMAVFNGERFIEEAILSVINQTYSRIEFIVIDGGSSDGTVDIIRKYQKDIALWISETDEGLYDAWNKGIAHSNGAWISFIGADDAYHPNAIELYSSYIDNIDNFEYITSKIRLVSPYRDNSKIIGKGWNWKQFKKSMNTAHVGSLHKRSMYDEKGLYDLDFKIAGDYEFLLRFQSSLRAGFLDKVTVDMRVGGISSSDAHVFMETALAKSIHTSRPKTLIYFEAFYSWSKWIVGNFLRNYFA